MKKFDSKNRVIEEIVTTWTGKLIEQKFYSYPSDNKIVIKTIKNSETLSVSHPTYPIREITYEAKMDKLSGPAHDENFRIAYFGTLNFFKNGKVNISLTEVTYENGIGVSESYIHYHYSEDGRNHFQYSISRHNPSLGILSKEITSELSKVEFLTLIKRTFIFSKFPIDNDYNDAIMYLERLY